MKKIAVSIHATDDFNLEIIKGLKDLDYIHIDVMDGKFVNNTNLNLDVFRIIRENSKYYIVAHLMVINPYDYIEKIIDFIDIFLFHFESEYVMEEIINKVKKFNKKVGLVINPETNISQIEPYLKFLDEILVMSVNPGWSGQKFIPEVINKINHLAQYKNKYNFMISVDGGININNAKLLRNADILCSSSTILNAKNPNKVIEKLKNIHKKS
ncbi:MAG: ribulose-phosphate 3-epimerase [Promethearchaeota archaeon]